MSRVDNPNDEGVQLLMVHTDIFFLLLFTRAKGVVLSVGSSGLIHVTREQDR